MSFEIAPVGANAVNTRPDIALLQANATSALAKISGDVKSANVAQVAPTNPPAGLVSSLAATQTAITSTQNAVNVLQTADAAYAKGVTLAQQGVALATDRLTAGVIPRPLTPSFWLCSQESTPLVPTPPSGAFPFLAIR